MVCKYIFFVKCVFIVLGIGIVFGVLLYFVYGIYLNVIILISDWFNIVG